MLRGVSKELRSGAQATGCVMSLSFLVSRCVCVVGIYWSRDVAWMRWHVFRSRWCLPLYRACEILHEMVYETGVWMVVLYVETPSYAAA